MTGIAGAALMNKLILPYEKKYTLIRPQRRINFVIRNVCKFQTKELVESNKHKKNPLS
jgi:hypothetical protein